MIPVKHAFLNIIILAVYAEALTSGDAHLRCLAPGQHSYEETSQRWRVVGDTVPI